MINTFKAQENIRLPQLHVLTKLAMFISITVSVFFIASLTPLLLILGLIIGGFYLCNATLGAFKWLIMALLLSAPTTMAIFVISFGVEKGFSQTVISMGAYEGALFLMRLFPLALANILFVKTTDAREIQLLFDALKFPSEISLLIATVFRFFPLMSQEALRIIEVQRSRGLKPTSLLRPKKFLPLVIPLLLINIQRSYEMNLSMELRGVYVAQTHVEIRFTKYDILVGVLVFCGLGLIFVA